MQGEELYTHYGDDYFNYVSSDEEEDVMKGKKRLKRKKEGKTKEKEPEKKKMRAGESMLEGRDMTPTRGEPRSKRSDRTRCFLHRD